MFIPLYSSVPAVLTYNSETKPFPSDWPTCQDDTIEPKRPQRHAVTVDLYILRHAEAGLDAPSDFDRTLTELGKHQLSQVVGRHQAAMASISQVWVSPMYAPNKPLHIRHWLPQSLAIETSAALTPESPPWRY